jgi:hypothetical protein
MQCCEMFHVCVVVTVVKCILLVRPLYVKWEGTTTTTRVFCLENDSCILHNIELIAMLLSSVAATTLRTSQYVFSNEYTVHCSLDMFA